MAKKILVIVLLLGLKAFAQNDARWEQHQNGERHGKPIDELTLKGAYVTPPSSAAETPRLLLQCSNRKFARGYLFVGVVAEHAGGWDGHTARSLKGRPQAQLDIRWDDTKKPASEFWELSDDRRSLLFNQQQFVRLMTGRTFGNPTDAQALLPVVYLSVKEAGANQIVMRFDLPRDPKQLVDVCGLQHVKRDF